MLTVAVLGPVEVRRDGELVVVPSGRNTELLVRLALSAGRMVTTDQLLADLWAGAATGVVKNTLQSKVSQLRRALVQPDSITGVRGGYRLAVNPADVDALRVVELSGTAHELRRAGNVVAALKSATEGLSLFRGAPFAEAGDGQWLLPHRIRLDQVRVGLLEDQLAAKVQLGAGHDVIGQLEGLVTQYPLRETLWYWLMTALYRNGRQADALAAYAQVRKTLVNELGLEPGRAFRTWKNRSCSAMSIRWARSPARRRTSPTEVGNLPRMSSPLIGRGPDLAAIHQAIRDQRLVTLVGTPGVGKTRLAIEVARQARSAAGSWLVRLDAIDTEVSIAQVVAETFSLTGRRGILRTGHRDRHLAGVRQLRARRRRGSPVHRSVAGFARPGFGCWLPVKCPWEWMGRSSTRWNRYRRRNRWCCSPAGRLGVVPSWSSMPTPRTASPGCASRSMGCRWPSNSPQPG